MEYTVTIIFNPELDKVIMQLKDRGIWSGKLNFPGGKVDKTDANIRESALREVYEETRLSIDSFRHYAPLVTLSFPDNCILHVFYGVLNKGYNYTQVESELLVWCPCTDLTDSTDAKLAGNGNIPYLIQSALISINKI